MNLYCPFKYENIHNFHILYCSWAITQKKNSVSLYTYLPFISFSFIQLFRCIFISENFLTQPGKWN